jgi:hypothetical protein
MSDRKDKNSLSASNGSIVIGGSVQGSNIVVGNHNTVSNQSINVAPLFEKIRAEVEKRPDLKPAEKEDIHAEFEEIQTEIEKPEPNEGFLARRFRNIKRMAPEIVEVAFETLKNPIGGVAEVVKRIANKMAEEGA